MRLTRELLRVHGLVFLSSDGTLNPKGVRFGSSEIYNIGACPLRESLALSEREGGRRLPTTELTCRRSSPVEE